MFLQPVEKFQRRRYLHGLLSAEDEMMEIYSQIAELRSAFGERKLRLRMDRQFKLSFTKLGN